MKLYHGTSDEYVAYEIYYEGLKGGDNTTGGNRGVWEKPLLFMTPYRAVAEKYGQFIFEYDCPDEELPNRINDQLGDPCYIFEGEDWDTVIINANDLYCEVIENDRQ